MSFFTATMLALPMESTTRTRLFAVFSTTPFPPGKCQTSGPARTGLRCADAYVNISEQATPDKARSNPQSIEKEKVALNMERYGKGAGAKL